VIISSIYLEPNGDINKIPVEILESDIIGGDMNKTESGLDREEVYHTKGITNIRTIEINKKISDHNIKIGEAKANLKMNERYTKMIINDIEVIRENIKELMQTGQKETVKLKYPKKEIIKDNHNISLQNIEKYDDFNKIKECYNAEFKEKYNRMEKIIRNGNIEKEGWYKINKLFDERKKSEIYYKEHMADKILEYYKNIYENNPCRTYLTHNEIKNNIYNILQIMMYYMPRNTDPIWPPKSASNDYNGFSQKVLEKIIRRDNLKEELKNYQYLLGIICKDDIIQEKR
jgi:hypothetical protein